MMWHDPEHNVLVYHARDPRILQYISTAKMINGDHTLVPVNFTNLQILRLLDYPVIRPLVNYEWPRSVAIKEPFHAQVETANFFAVHPRSCCFSDMGTGKTLSALWAADALMADAASRREPFRALVVARLSTLQTVWADTIFQNFMGRRKAVIIHGSEKKRLALLNEPADFYIINHDGIKVGTKYHKDKQKHQTEFGGFTKALADRTDVQLIIIDEVASFRNHRSLRSRVARTLFKDRSFLWLMTGTPTPQGPLDAYGIAYLLNGARGKVFTHWRNEIMYQISQYEWAPKAGANEKAHALMAPSIRFRLEDCHDIPQLTTQTRMVELSSQQARLIHEIENHFVIEMQKGTVTAVHEAALRIKLIQIACGEVYDGDHNANSIDCAPRLAVLRELIEDAGGKVIIFVPFTSLVDRLKRELKEFTSEIIDGRVSFRDRNEIIKKFQNGADPRLLIAQPETIQEGQNLTASATIIWYGPVDKTLTYIQASARIQRPGQKRNCTVINMIATEVEKETFRRLQTNQKMQGILLKLVEGRK